MIDGPFAETKELVAGYWVWELKSLQEAIDWVKRCPNPHTGESEIEIRRMFEPEEFENAPPEVIEQEKKFRSSGRARRSSAMRFLVLVKATPSTEAGGRPSPELPPRWPSTATR